MTDDWPDPWMDRLKGAIRDALSDSSPTEIDVDWAARSIDRARNFGLLEEKPNSLPAGQNASEAELRQFHDACARVAEIAEGLHRPAVAALFDEGLNVRDIVQKMGEAQEIARAAFGAVQGEVARGRPPKVVARDVTCSAGWAYERLTGKRPTFSTDPLTSEVTGAWPSFLAAVFEALYIEASVTAQVQRFRVRTRSPFIART
ncbi:hypothetical protein [Tabrizicola caldifontis]|uniref:hypothetical protein n=1 Tax=Tabrizicola caldifontis TaxID=2528036 RepID=UPI001080A9FE|nr:hypothetical protein [Rhodobacter sp. YIM 73028]